MTYNALYVQSGGPTSVINSSAYGVISECRENADKIGKLYASEHGLAGVISGRLFDLSVEEPQQCDLLKQTPAMIFGSCRHMISNEDCKKFLHTLEKFHIRYLFMNGGNGTVRSCCQLYEFLTAAGYDFRIIEIPKTIDNDISKIDHSPGFPSAARHLAIGISELVQDMLVYDTDLIMVAEVMGRKSGYLAASTLAAATTGFGPDLIYVPEVVFDRKKFVQDIAETLSKKGKCFAVISEGVKNADGKYLFEGTTVNKTDNPVLNMGGVTPYISALLRKHFPCKIRGIDMGLMQRCAAHDISSIDRREAILLGRAAVRAALNGTTGKMMSLQRISSTPYRTKIIPLELESVANSDKSLPNEYINDSNNGIQNSFLDYIMPLIGELPVYASLHKKIAE